jgi:hypothetical protein
VAIGPLVPARRPSVGKWGPNRCTHRPSESQTPTSRARPPACRQYTMKALSPQMVSCSKAVARCLRGTTGACPRQLDLGEVTSRGLAEQGRPRTPIVNALPTPDFCRLTNERSSQSCDSALPIQGQCHQLPFHPFVASPRESSRHGSRMAL